MSLNEINRLDVIRKVVEQGLSQTRAAEALKLSERQIRRLVASYKATGPIGIISTLSLMVLIFKVPNFTL